MATRKVKNILELIGGTPLVVRKGAWHEWHCRGAVIFITRAGAWS